MIKVKIGKNAKNKNISAKTPLEMFNKLVKYKDQGYILWIFNNEYKRYMDCVDFENFLEILKGCN